MYSLLYCLREGNIKIGRKQEIEEAIKKANKRRSENGNGT